MPKAQSQLGRWQGFVVKRKQGGASAKDKVISGLFETTSGAQAYMDLAKKGDPGSEFYIAEQVRGRA